MRGVNYTQVREQVDVARVLRLVGFQVHWRKGEQMRGPCPLHGSTSKGPGTFSVNLARGVWRCFKCQRGGNVLDLWVAHTGQPIYQATIDLCEKLGIDVPWVKPPQGRQQRRGTRR